ncbi:hypothetical cytosolic protein [Syntrophus aciditrophicus SB]|uniref:Hypothetical cytosolic protein n=1 Tax=Syntrophus aciditrophicus (strain SB) TaxID=56780 RepID=Q2LQ22_SYNAS|nr:hypothetical cytosolic protein [Syntrophus aciditrophicus SB]
MVSICFHSTNTLLFRSLDPAEGSSLIFPERKMSRQSNWNGIHFLEIKRRGLNNFFRLDIMQFTT